VRELAVVWLVAVTALAYINVPLQHAVLFAANLVLQASLGGLVIVRLMKRVVPSLLLLCGPGLILGGALSFAIFQVVGRGTAGMTAQTVAAAGALTVLLKDPSSYSQTQRPATLGAHMLGLTALAMSSEFPWLLIAAAAGFLVAYLLGSQYARSATSKWVVFAICAGLLALATAFRGDYWWLITDDYKFFEVLTRHLTNAGPLTNWGSLDVSRYHWLSYGWAGLLDVSAASPDTLVTLTRVMPFVYSATLASSLLLITEQLSPQLPFVRSFVQTLPVWVLVSGIRLDWAAPSTAGALAVLASTVAVTLLILRHLPPVRSRMCLYLILVATMTFTKLPSALTLPALLLGTEILLSRQQRLVARPQLYAMTAVSVAALCTVALLEPLSAVLGDFTVRWTIFEGGSITSGLPFSLVSPLSQHFWLSVAITVAWIVTSRTKQERGLPVNEILLLSLTPLFLGGLIANAVIPNSDKSNVQEYFSTPNYFLAALSIVLLGARLPRSIERTRWRRVGAVCSAIFACVIGVELIAQKFDLPAPFNEPSVMGLLKDGRSLTGIVVVAALLLRWTQVRLEPSILVVLLLAVSLVEPGSTTVSQLVDKGVRPTLPATELVSYLGDQESRVVGNWLRQNTDNDDLVATNSLFVVPRSRIYGDDYSLAMWSRREFLVLGPKFFGAAETASDEIGLSIRFAAEPTEADFDSLRKRGVRWFIIDTLETDRSTWEPFATVEFKTERFVVLRLLVSS